MNFSLRAKSVLLGILLDLVLSAGIGFSIYRVSEARFRESFFEQKLDLVRGLARLIDGETHARFTRPGSVNDPEYRRYLHTLNGILQEQSFIRYLYSLNYDAQSGGFLYAVDAGLAESDTVWVECDQFALVLTPDAEGGLQVEYDERTYSSDFDLQVGGVPVPLSLKPGPEGLQLLLGDQLLCTVTSLRPLRLMTAAGEISESRRLAEIELSPAGQAVSLQLSFTKEGESDSMPGTPYVDTPENIARLKKIFEEGKDYVEREIVRDIYGASQSLYGIVRDRDAQPVGVLEMDVYRTGLEKFQRSIALIGFIVAAATFLVVVGVVIAYSEYLLIPIRRIHAAVQHVSNGRLDVEVGSRRRDELGELARGVTGMVRSLAAHQEEQRKDKEKLSQLAFFDTLTGLQNRKSFYERLGESLAQARRHGGNTRALLFLDLDDFKDVNDSLGHDVGDRVLQVVAGRIRSGVRASDYVFRPGGDEFAVLLTSLSHETDAAVVAEKLIQQVRQPIVMGAQNLYLGLSVGITLFPRDADSLESLVRSADVALFEAKKQGNTYHFFTPQLQAQAEEKMRVIDHLHRGVQAGQFELFYQPIVTASGNVSGGEALLRWNHPEWGRLSPPRFIGLAEETGLIVPLGHWVVQEACRCLEEITAAGLASPFISVNLSVRQLREPSFVQALEELLRGRNFALERLHFEVTESLLLESSETMATIRALKDLGVRLVIDDFGIGYSSLSRLKDMPINGLKLDRSFIAKLAVQKRDREIVRAVIAIAHELKLFVVAEGVERPDQVEFLHSTACDALQGYIYDPPLPAAEFLRLVREYSGPKCLPLKDVPGSEAKHPA
jgi:diguanylate cyclase (GGDEF)-like protein